MHIELPQKRKKTMYEVYVCTGGVYLFKKHNIYNIIIYIIGESYNDLYPGTIYSPPSYDVRFPSAIMSS